MDTMNHSINDMRKHGVNQVTGLIEIIHTKIKEHFNNTSSVK